MHRSFASLRMTRKKGFLCDPCGQKLFNAKIAKDARSAQSKTVDEVCWGFAISAPLRNLRDLRTKRLGPPTCAGGPIGGLLELTKRWSLYRGL